MTSLPQLVTDTMVQHFVTPSAPARIYALEATSIVHNSEDLSTMGLHSDKTWSEFHDEVDLLKQSVGDGKPIKSVFMIRHGEGDHNAAERRLGKEQWENVEAKKDEYFDAALNQVGREQAAAMSGHVQTALQNGLKIDLIVVSPLTRAIETAKFGLQGLYGEVPVVAMEWCREHYGKNTPDKRRSVDELKQLYPEIDFDHFMVSNEDSWWTETRETDEQVNARVEKFFNWLMQLPDEFSNVMVVGHSSYMAHSITWVGMPYHWPANCEIAPMVLTVGEDVCTA